MAQLVARLVRNEKVGGSNPPSSTTGRHPIRMSVFCMPGRVGVVPVVVLLVAPLVFRALRCDALWGPAAVCAGGRRPAREIATRELRSEWSISRPALALPPPTGTAAGPRHRPRAPQPDPTAHGHRSRAPPPPTGTAAWLRCPHRYGRALRSLRRPPHWRHLACWCVADRAPSPPTGAAAWTRRRPSTRGQGFRLDCNSCFQRGTCEPCV